MVFFDLLSKSKFGIKSVILLCALVSVSTITASDNRDDKSPLEESRKQFNEYTPEAFDLGGELSRYLWKNFAAFYPHAEISRTGPMRALPENLRSDVAAYKIKSDLGELSFDQYVKTETHIDAVIVLHDGEVVYEAYPDLKPYQKHLAWSVTKVFVSTALAILEHQGKVNMSLPVEHYLPELKNTAWMGTSVQNIVNMASGMDCLDSDGYQNTTTCIYQYEESLGITARKNKPITTLEHIKQVKRRAPQGTINEYVSINTYVVGMVIESVTEKPLWLAMQDLIWSNIGAEADALFTISPQGNAYTSAGLNARLRDIARFGELFTSEQGIKVIGEAHLTDLKSGNIIQFNSKQKQSYTDSFGNDLPTHAAWQWDHIWPDGDMYKSGYSGQGIFVSPERKLVIAFFGTHGKDWKEHQLDAISRQLSRSGLFSSD